MRPRGASFLALVLLAVCGCGESVTRAPAAPPSLDGVRQSAFELGSPAAPSTMTLYVDPFCVGSGCASLDAPMLSAIVERHVRPGDLRIVLRPVTAPGFPETAVREAFAASLQGHGWDFVLAFLARGGSTADPYEVARSVRGLDLERLRRDARSERVTAAVMRAEERRSRRRADVPSAWFDPPGGGDDDVERLALRDRDALLGTIDRLMAEAAAGAPPSDS